MSGDLWGNNDASVASYATCASHRAYDLFGQRLCPLLFELPRTDAKSPRWNYVESRSRHFGFWARTKDSYAKLERSRFWKKKTLCKCVLRLFSWLYYGKQKSSTKWHNIFWISSTTNIFCTFFPTFQAETVANKWLNRWKKDSYEARAIRNVTSKKPLLFKGHSLWYYGQAIFSSVIKGC